MEAVAEAVAETGLLKLKVELNLKLYAPVIVIHLARGISDVLEYYA